MVEIAMRGVRRVILQNKLVKCEIKIFKVSPIFFLIIMSCGCREELAMGRLPISYDILKVT